MPTDNDCIFCRITAGLAPCHEVYSDATVMAFMDAFPAAPGHLLVVPREHARTIHALGDEAMREVASVARQLAGAVDAALNPDGLTLSQANGAAAGQSVPHYHVHLIPRTSGERLRSHGAASGDDAALAQMALRIRAELYS